MNDFRQRYEDAYWVVRKVLENACFSLESPHTLWSDLNELIEVCDSMERVLEIANPTDAFKR